MATRSAAIGALHRRARRRPTALAPAAMAGLAMLAAAIGAVTPDTALGAWPAAIDLASLNGGNGFRMDGLLDGDSAGMSVSPAGDVNGDGIADLIIGAPNAGPDPGAAYVVFGTRGTRPASVDLRALDGVNGFRITGAAPNEQLGYSVSAAGDVNGDGIDDVIVGAPFSGAGAAASPATSTSTVPRARASRASTGSPPTTVPDSRWRERET